MQAALYWSTETSLGTFFITLRQDGRWELRNESEVFGSWATPKQAADDFGGKHSGCCEWDMSDHDGPLDLGEWEAHRR